MFRIIREPDCFATAASADEIAHVLGHARPGRFIVRRSHRPGTSSPPATLTAAGEPRFVARTARSRSTQIDGLRDVASDRFYNEELVEIHQLVCL